MPSVFFLLSVATVGMFFLHVSFSALCIVKTRAKPQTQAWMLSSTKINYCKDIHSTISFDYRICLIRLFRASSRSVWHLSSWHKYFSSIDHRHPCEHQLWPGQNDRNSLETKQTYANSYMDVCALRKFAFRKVMAHCVGGNYIPQAAYCVHIVNIEFVVTQSDHGTQA